jgi:hypothetical protein
MNRYIGLVAGILVLAALPICAGSVTVQGGPCWPTSVDSSGEFTDYATANDGC